VDQLLEPAFADGLTTMDTGELRARRDQCQRAEVAVSYVRRVLQGELDLVQAELSARSAGTRGDVGSLVKNLPAILADSGSRSGSRAGPTGASRDRARGAERLRRPDAYAGGVVEGWRRRHDVALEELLAAVMPVTPAGFGGEPDHAAGARPTRAGDPTSGRPVERADSFDQAAEAHGDGALPAGNLAALSDEQLVMLGDQLKQAEQSVSATRRDLHERIDLFQEAIVARHKSGTADVHGLLEQ